MPLHPEAQAFLDGLAALELPPLETLDAETQRAMFGAENPDGPTPPEVASVDDRSVPGAAGDIPVRIYRPSNDDGLPAIVFFHGGGWVIGNLDSHDHLCRALANAAGALVVNVDYRLAPENAYPAAYDDCVSVFAWTVANAAELGADASRVAVAGDSAGGNLSASVAMWARDNDTSLAAQVLIYPATNLAEPDTASYKENGEGYLLTKGWMDWFIDQYVPNAADRSQIAASPALADSLEGLAPAIVLTAEFDPLRDDGKNYADALSAAGVTADYTNFDGQVHGFASQIGVMTDAQVAADQIGEFLKATW